jgi:hypothetical protein
VIAREDRLHTALLQELQEFYSLFEQRRINWSALGENIAERKHYPAVISYALSKWFAFAKPRELAKLPEGR